MKNKKTLLAIAFAAAFLLASTNCYSANGAPEGTVPQKIKAMWVYKDVNDEQKDLTVSNGINTFCTKIGWVDDFDLDDPNEWDNIMIRKFAAYAKNKNIAFFPVINFGICAHDFPGTQEKTFYYSGIDNQMKQGILVPLLNEAYWNYFTEKVKGIAELAKEEEYRIDGIKIDFELYDDSDCNPDQERYYYYRYYGNFDDTAFNKFVELNSLNPPAEREKRYDWLKENRLLNDYNNFVKQKVQELARKFKQEINTTNPNFLIGEYPSPTQYYTLTADILKGWEEGKPGILFGHDTYTINSPEKEKYNLTQTGDGYFIYKREPLPPVKVYYAGGFLLSSYKPENFDQVLEIAENCNGYWLFSSAGMFRKCEDLTGNASGFRIPVNCEQDQNDPGCCTNQQGADDYYWQTKCCPHIEEARQEYWNAIKLTNYKLDCQKTNNGTEICDSIDNDCDNEIDEDNVCAQKCVDTDTLMNQYIPQWKRGEISMLALMQKMRQWKTGPDCPN